MSDEGTTKKTKQGSGKRLNDKQRVEIIQIAENSKISKRQLADKYGVSEAAIRKLLLKKDDFLKRYYDTPEEIRDQRLRGKNLRFSGHEGESSAAAANVAIQTGTVATNNATARSPSVNAMQLYSKSLYPPDDPWKQGLQALLAKITPFLKSFMQSKSQPSSASALEAALAASVASTNAAAAAAAAVASGAPMEGVDIVTVESEASVAAAAANAAANALVDDTMSLDWVGFSRMLRDIRRGLHRYPEVGYQEVRTHAFIKKFCEQTLHIPGKNIRVMASTGLVVDVCYENATITPSDKRKLPVLAFRADMDALPIEELNKHLPYCSTQTKGRKEQREAQTVPAAAHMCGHDGHMVMVLGLCAMVVRSAHLLPKDTFVRFVFQPAEEGPGGAKKMIEDGALTDVDEIYGLHNAPFPLYSVHVRPGAVMAHEVEFSIDIHGIGGHGSAPQQCVDPILAGAAVVQSLQSVVSRSLSPMDTAVVSVTQFRGGDANNVIPSRVYLAGTIRDFDLQIADKIKDRVAKLVHSTCAGYGATANVHFLDGYAPVINPHEETRQVQQVAMDIGLYVSEQGLPLMAAEDFSYFLQERKGCYFFLGTKEEGDPDKSRALHSNHYDFNDKAIPLGIRMFLGILQSRFGCELYSSEELQAFQVAMERISLNVSVV
ncbi:hypothetical protein BBI17_002385 [Phytophthora kernoviae]|uniref:Peptidase M20 dimerisation domain-containing protein n=1 Tax=Phytophthora kernoviae TaxID=325452 RepID=A0A3R7G545_9STRA|nr:hypothetical protein JM16_004671 [Phytophthora kernoviae]RLN36782.1 hypothetical protein BBI17_002385 [Phytophthora kernoviae]